MNSRLRMRLNLDCQQRFDSHLCGSSPLINSAIERGVMNAQRSD